MIKILIGMFLFYIISTLDSKSIDLKQKNSRQNILIGMFFFYIIAILGNRSIYLMRKISTQRKMISKENQDNLHSTHPLKINTTYNKQHYKFSPELYDPVTFSNVQKTALDSKNINLISKNSIQSKIIPKEKQENLESKSLLKISEELYDPITFLNVQETVYLTPIHTILDPNHSNSPLIKKIRKLIKSSNTIVILAYNLNLQQIIRPLVDKLSKYILEKDFKLEIFLDNKEFEKFDKIFLSNLNTYQKKVDKNILNERIEIHKVAGNDYENYDYDEYVLFHHKKMIFSQQKNTTSEIINVIDGSANFTNNGFNRCSDSTSLKKYQKEDAKNFREMIEYVKKDVINRTHHYQYEIKINEYQKYFLAKKV